jgi:membrane protein DedA with SNARE-associated domain
VAQSLLDWLVTLPAAALYVVLGLVAAIENFVPPFPADVTVAFGSFLAAQGHEATLAMVALVTWTCNVAGAMAVYALARRYGAERFERRLAGKHAQSWDARLHRMFDRYGTLAVLVGRFVPGVRALVPAVAGAVRAPVLKTMFLIGLASAIWYGAITYIAYRVGSNWETVRTTIGKYSTVAGIIAAAVLAAGIVTWLLGRRRKEG